jgi:hypothetical protein
VVVAVVQATEKLAEQAVIQNVLLTLPEFRLYQLLLAAVAVALTTTTLQVVVVLQVLVPICQRLLVKELEMLADTVVVAQELAQAEILTFTVVAVRVIPTTVAEKVVQVILAVVRLVFMLIARIPTIKKH